MILLGGWIVTRMHHICVEMKAILSDLLFRTIRKLYIPNFIGREVHVRSL